MAKSVNDITVDGAPPATNEVSQDLFLHYVGQQEQLEAEIKVLRKKKAKLRRDMRINGIRLTDMDLSLKMRAVEDDDVILESMRAIKKYSAFLGLPIGTQLSLLDDVPSDLTDSDDLDQRAYDFGRRAGALGEFEDDNPYDLGSSQGQKWLKGYRDAQKAIAMQMAPKDEPEEQEEPEDEPEELPIAAE